MKKLQKSLISLSLITFADNVDQDSKDLKIKNHTKGVETIITALKVSEQKGDSTPIDLLLLKNWRDMAIHDRIS